MAGSTWPCSPIDAFILAQQEAAGLRPAPAARRRTLLRRATLDLWGIPPCPEEIDSFLRDDSDQAFERVVDRLLASPHYGERWGRHWLDVVRYADSNGMDDNLAYSDAWRYRDYVIAAFNADKPFDRFVEEQIAGDLLAEAEPGRRDELVVATGFLAIGPKMLAEDDPVKQQMDIVDEQLDTTCRAFLALTMGCARCHDHKFDPLDMGDYYGMAGIFKSTRTMITFRVDSKWNATGAGRLREPSCGSRTSSKSSTGMTMRSSTAIPPRCRRRSVRPIPACSRTRKKEYAAIPKAMAVGEGKVGDLEIFLRGNHLTRGPIAPRRFPTIVAGDEQPPLAQAAERPARAGAVDDRHRESADRPCDRQPRVAMAFRPGPGAVGRQFRQAGRAPSHPELLDWLATSLVARWLVVEEAPQAHHAFPRLSDEHGLERAGRAASTPRTVLLWRMPRRRMEAEVLRDSLLAASGQLDTAMGGTPIATAPFREPHRHGNGASSPTLYQSTRRSVYLPVLRSAVYDLFQAYRLPRSGGSQRRSRGDDGRRPGAYS